MHLPLGGDAEIGWVLAWLRDRPETLWDSLLLLPGLGWWDILGSQNASFPASLFFVKVPSGAKHGKANR